VSTQLKINSELISLSKQIDEIKDEKVISVLNRLLNIIEELHSENISLKEENQRLRDENNHLKRELGKPAILGNTRGLKKKV